MSGPKTVRVRVRRFDPDAGDRPSWSEYAVPLLDRVTVLDALFYIVANLDSGVSFRCACRAAMCGSCGMVMNGREGLACRTQLSKLGSTVRVEPLRNLPLVKDLVVDMEPFFEKYARIVPYVVPDDGNDEPAVIPAGSPLRDLVDEHLDCITCGACYSACELVASDPSYLGPAALNRAYCVTFDVRDARRAERLELVQEQHGVWRCHQLFECTQVCPKNLIPTRAIRRLKRGGLHA